MKRSLRSWLWRVPVDQEVDEEIAFHVEMRTRDLIASGLDPVEARRRAESRLGNLQHLRKTCIDLGRKRDRHMNVAQWIEEFRHDVVFALRQLRDAPAFTVVATLTLALGIGANSAIFALVDATLLRPLPFHEPDRVVTLFERTSTGQRTSVSPMNLADWQAQSRTVSAMAGYSNGVGGMVMKGTDGMPETVARQWVSSRFFEVLGVQAMVGRVFQPADDFAPASAVVLSEPYWRARFNADPSVVGTSLVLDGDPYTVAGVAPASFHWTERASVWALQQIRPDPRLRTAYFLRGIGRLGPGASVEAARAELGTIAAEIARTVPENRGRGVMVEPVRDVLVGTDLKATSMLFLGVVGFVLLICCTNVANLLLARGTARSRELAIRAALGAGRGRVVRQLLTESLVLAVLGGVLGVGLGAAILAVAPALVPEGVLPTAAPVGFDARVIAFCALASLGVGVLFGLAPAWQSSDDTAARMIATDTRTSTGRGGSVRAVLVVAEVATAVLLLVGAGLLLRTLLAVQNVDRGYRAEAILTMAVDPLSSQYPTPERLRQFYDQVGREVAAVPGVAHVAWASTLPLGPSYGGSVGATVAGDPPPADNTRPMADMQIVSPSYFAALDLPVVEGRAFDQRDSPEGPKVCIVNEAFVRRHLQGRQVLGTQVALTPGNAPNRPPTLRQIIGVARQVKGRPDETEDLVQIYVPMTQGVLDDTFLLVRPAVGTAAALAPAVRAAIARIDTAQLVSVGVAETLDDVAHEATSAHRFRAVLVLAFASLALLLAMVGVFGILAYSVQQRMRDFAVRRAMGATSGDVLRLVAGSAARVVATGAVVGLALAMAASRVLTAVLFGVTPLDPVTFGVVAAVLTLTAVVAIAAPAWRATRIDPALVLRAR